jgi:hypothetical protein
MLRGLIETWSCGTREERGDILRMILEAIYVNVPKGIVVALHVKPAFKPLFRAWLDNNKPQCEAPRFTSADIVHGDPEGARGRQSLTVPRWGGLLLARVVSPLSIVGVRPRPAKRVRVPDSQLPLFLLS